MKIKKPRTDEDRSGGDDAVGARGGKHVKHNISGGDHVRESESEETK